MTELRSAPANPGRPQGGPHPLVPALAYGALMIAWVAVSVGGPNPATPAAEALAYARTHTGQLHAGALLAFGAAVPLAVWTATIYRRLRTLGVTAPGAVIGLAGGVLAAGSIGLSGLMTWAGAPARPRDHVISAPIAAVTAGEGGGDRQTHPGGGPMPRPGAGSGGCAAP